MRMKFLKILKIAGISLIILGIIYFFLPLKLRLDILIAVYPPMREEMNGVFCGLGIQDRMTAVTWVVKGSSMKELVDCIDHENLFVNMTAATLVDRNRNEAIPLLLEQAQNGNDSMRIRALDYLRSFGPDSLSVIDDLEQMLDEDDLPIRTGVFFAVCTINPNSEAAISVLFELLESENAADRMIVPSGLHTLNLPADEVIPILIDLLEDENEAVRSNAAVILGIYGSRAMEAIPALEAAYEQTEDEFCRERIAKAITTIEGFEESGE